MKILLVARWPVGGIRTYFRYVYGQSVFAPYQFTLVCPDMDVFDFIKTYLPATNIRLIFCENSDESLRRSVAKLLREESFDLVHSHGYSAGVLTVVANIFGRHHHIMTAHDVYRPEQFLGVKGRLKLTAINLAFARLNGVLTVGKDCFDNFRGFIPLVKKEKLQNIDHGVDVERFFNAGRRDFRTELELPVDRKIIAFMGRFMSQKGFYDLIMAIKQLSARLPEQKMPAVLTFGWGGFIREDYALIEQLGLSSYFIQLPFTDDVPAAIKGADMVVMPSRWEACGLLAMEVLAAGTPLIGTDCIGLRCVLEGTPARVVPPYAPEALAVAIEQQLASDDSDFKRYQPIAMNRFNMTRPALELHNYYQAIAVKGVGQEAGESH